MCGALLLHGGGLTAVSKPLQALIEAICRIDRSIQVFAYQGVILYCACWDLHDRTLASRRLILRAFLVTDTFQDDTPYLKDEAQSE